MTKTGIKDKKDSTLCSDEKNLLMNYSEQSMWLIISFTGKLDLSKFKHAQRIWLNRLIVF